MRPLQWLRRLRTTIGRGVFPHQMAFFLELPWRRLVLSPRQLADRLRLEPDARVLEVGAGSGFYSVEVARRLPAGWLDLLDVQPEMLEKARRKLADAGIAHVGFHASDAAGLPFADGSFEVVYLVTVLGEIASRDAFLDETRRVLRPGGVLSVSEHLPDPDFLSAATVRALGGAHGFELVRRDGPAWSHTVTLRRA